MTNASDADERSCLARTKSETHQDDESDYQFNPPGHRRLPCTPCAARREYPWFVYDRCARRAWRESIVSVASAQYGSSASIRSMVLPGVTSRFRDTFVKLHPYGVVRTVVFPLEELPREALYPAHHCVVNGV